MTTAFDTADEAAIQQCEERLRSAMLSSDVEALDVLLANDLIFIDHQGRRIEKAQDLEAHRSGVLALEQIDVLDSIIRPLGNAVLVSLRVRFTGTYYGEKFSEKLAFTRVWSRTADDWAVTLAHCSRITM